MEETGQGFPTWGLRNSLVSTGPGRKPPGWTVRNGGEETCSGLTVRPGAAGQVRPARYSSAALHRRGVSVSAEESVVARTASERGPRWATPRRVWLLPRPGGWAGGHLQDMSPPRGALASGGLAPQLPSARGHSPRGCSPAPVTPSRFRLGAAPRGAGPRCWPGGFWSEAQSLCCLRRRNPAHRPE